MVQLKMHVIDKGQDQTQTKKIKKLKKVNLIAMF